MKYIINNKYSFISYSAVGQQIPLLKLPKKEKRSLQLQDVFLVVYTLHEDIFVAGNILKI